MLQCQNLEHSPAPTYEVESKNSWIIMVGTALSALRAVSTMHSKTTDCKDQVIVCVGHCARTVSNAGKHCRGTNHGNPRIC